MKRYLEKTCNDICELCLNNGDVHLWKVEVPSLSAKHPFLYHGMLSLSALHQDRAIALEHHNTGLSLFRRSFDDDVEALFAFQCMLLMFAYGISEPTLLGFKTVVGVIRGSSVILSGRLPKDGIFKSILNLEVEGPRREVEWLTKRLNGSISASIYHDVYVKAIELLGYALGVAPDPQYRQVVANNVWILMPQEFLNLMWMGEGLALAIMAGFGVALHWSCEDNVFLKGWGRGLVGSVRELLGEEWNDCVEWAVKEVEGNSTPSTDAETPTTTYRPTIVESPIGVPHLV